MSSLFPTQQAILQSFGSPLVAPANKPTPYQARPEYYGAYSIVDDAKNKAQQLSKEAQAEFDKASNAAKPSKIELYSGKYYAACTFGGMLACVRSI
jgi:solute carrier family 25 (mitochondrial phosphate transporter), member 3